MKWFKHSSTASHDLPVRRILDAYGYQGYGLLWCIRERVEQADGFTKIDNLEREFCRHHVSRMKIRHIIEMSGMFDISEDGMVSVNGTTRAIFSPDRAQSACANKVNNLERDKEKDKKKKDIKKDSSKDAQICVCMSEPEKIFLEKMRVEYPRVSSMKQPLTYAQFLRLQKILSKDELLALLNDMENYPKLTTNCLSANLTIRSWHNRNSHRK